ncbi:MAG: cell wall hydrolase [Lachnospiraceae bacterium]|nr:cell wall hydrolase [Lachnospiraceae bacterium]
MKENVKLQKITIAILSSVAMLMMLIAYVPSMTMETYATELESSEVLVQAIAGAAEAVETGTTPTSEEVAIIAEEQANAWKAPGALVMADVNTAVNVRAEADENAALAGVLYKDCGGYIEEYTDEWTLITTGDLKGWVSNDYLLFGDEAEALAKEIGTDQAFITAENLRVRKAPDAEADIYGLVNKGETYEVLSQENGWVEIDYDGENGYISADYAEVAFHVGEGETVESIQARMEAERIAKEKAAKASRKASSSAATAARKEQYYGKYAADASDVVLLGALIQCEAGNQPYEGQVAVGAVVMNRVRCGAYPNTIYGVIYAPYQFTPAGTGHVDKQIAVGVNPSCLQAAQEALNGYSNVGNAMYFRRAGKHDGIVIGAHVFW